MIAREIERASQREDPMQKQYSAGLKVILDRAKRDGFSDPHEETTYDIIVRIQDSKRKFSGSIEDAISVALARSLEPNSTQERLGQRLMNVFNSFKANGFIDPPVHSSSPNS